MRGPKRWAVDVRLPDGKIVSKVTESVPLAKRFKLLGLPFIRGIFTLFESLAVGYKALDFSAAALESAGREAEEAKKKASSAGGSPENAAETASAGQDAGASEAAAEKRSGLTPQSAAFKGGSSPHKGGNGASPPEEALTEAADPEKAGKAFPPAPADAPGKAPKESLGPLSISTTIIFSLILAVIIFVAAPHWLALKAGGFFGFTEKNTVFHILDGLIKFVFFLAYIWGIGKIPDIKRVYSYHGAEHRAIYAYEASLPLEPLYARHFPLWHPRCGTAFIFLLLALSIIFFAIVFPLLFNFEGGGAAKRTVLAALLKTALTLPLAGVSYEISRRAGKPHPSFIWQIIIFPGLLIQRLTTRETDDSQLEVALCALSEALNLTPPDSQGAKASSFKDASCSTTPPSWNSSKN